MDESWRELEGVHERIRWSRLRRTQFTRPTDAAQSMGMRPGTYRTYEHSKADGGRIPPLVVIQQIAKKFDISWLWLATGIGGPDEDVESELRVVSERLAARVAQVPDDKKEDAIRAAESVLESYVRRAS